MKSYRTLTFTIWIVSTALALVLVIIALLYLNFPDKDQSFFQDVIAKLFLYPPFWILVSIPYLLSRLIKFWIQSYKRGGWSLLSKRLRYSLVIPLALIGTFFFTSKQIQRSEQFDFQWDEDVYNTTGIVAERLKEDKKIRGVHVFGSIDSVSLPKMIRANISSITLVPYAYQDDIDDPNLRYHFSKEQEEYYEAIWSSCQERNMSLILKPHIWIANPSDGKWRSDIEMHSEYEWHHWEERYTNFILNYARLSEQLDLPYFCIGTELHLSTTRRPFFWVELIKKVREVYAGKLVYGANWDREFSAITFWDQLDFIGIQAYFPLVDSDAPQLKQLISGWKKHLPALGKFSLQHRKKVLFTELGYKSTPDAGRLPWEWESVSGDLFRPVSLKTQVHCYRAFFDQVWPNDWFAGALIWNWESDEMYNHTFSIQSKPAYNEVAKGFYSAPETTGLDVNKLK